MQNNSPVEKINEKLAAILFDKDYELPEIKREIILSKSELEDYIGDYKYNDDFIIKIFMENKRLYVQGSDQPSFHLKAISKKRFFINEADWKFVLSRRMER